MNRTFLIACLVACGNSGAHTPIVPDGELGDGAPDAPAFQVVAGALDPSFGTNGRLTMDLGGNDIATGVVIEPSGRIVVMTINSSQQQLLGFTPDGVLDPTFGINGIAAVADTHKVINGPVVETADAIWIFGESYNDPCFCVERHHLDGAIDTTYGSGGIGSPSIVLTSQLTGETWEAVDANGRVVTAYVDASGNVAVTRLAATGYTDSTFGTNGVSSSQVAGSARGIAIQSDGAIVVALYPTQSATELVRFHPDGSIDSSYSPPAATAMIVPSTVAMASDELIVAANSVDNDPALYGYRLTKNGELDAPFPVRFDVGPPMGAGLSVIARHDNGFAIAGAHFTTDAGGFVAELDPTGLTETLWQTSGYFTAAAYDATDRVVAVGATGMNGGIVTNDILIARLAH